jgi:LacI family transcriptional regulator
MFHADRTAALQALIHVGPPQAGFGGDAFRRIMAADMPPTALVLGSPRYAMSILLAAKEKISASLTIFRWWPMAMSPGAVYWR